MTTKTRLVRLVVGTALAAFVATPLLAQEPSAARPFGLDPYKPSDAKILRDLGPALATRMSVDDLAKLDPYNPTDAALLRQLGGAIPLCCLELLPPVGPVIAGAMGPTRWHVLGAATAARERQTATSDSPRTTAKPPSDPNIVWVCNGSSCEPQDVRTHQFSRPPAGADALSSGALPVTTPNR